VFVAV